MGGGGGAELGAAKVDFGAAVVVVVLSAGAALSVEELFAGISGRALALLTMAAAFSRPLGVAVGVATVFPVEDVSLSDFAAAGGVLLAAAGSGLDFAGGGVALDLEEAAPAGVSGIIEAILSFSTST